MKKKNKIFYFWLWLATICFLICFFGLSINIFTSFLIPWNLLIFIVFIPVLFWVFVIFCVMILWAIGSVLGGLAKWLKS